MRPELDEGRRHGVELPEFRGQFSAFESKPLLHSLGLIPERGFGADGARLSAPGTPLSVRFPG